LVEELAGILWRKRRLRMAEGALHHRGLRHMKALTIRDAKYGLGRLIDFARWAGEACPACPAGRRCDAGRE